VAEHHHEDGDSAKTVQLGDVPRARDGSNSPYRLNRNDRTVNLWSSLCLYVDEACFNLDRFSTY
jgi:hypothetical protein